MRVPKFITFTGIDDRTDLTQADHLARTYPIEWGVLVSNTNRDARFPCAQAVAEIMDIAGQKSAHFCGQACKRLVKDGVLPNWVNLEEFNRTQLNGKTIPEGPINMLERIYHVECIVQTRSEFSRYDWPLELYDCSGGRGKLPENLPLLPKAKFVGYAGGMGPETVKDYLSRIEGEGEFWIDMEGQIRTNGWFDLDKVRRVCDAVFR